MIHGEYKKKLYGVFDVLGFSEAEKVTALESFKKKLAFALLQSVNGNLSPEEQELIRQPQPSHDQVAMLQKSITAQYSEEELYQKSLPLFRKILDDYIIFMVQRVDPETAAKLKQAAY